MTVRRQWVKSSITKCKFQHSAAALKWKEHTHCFHSVQSGDPRQGVLWPIHTASIPCSQETLDRVYACDPSQTFPHRCQNDFRTDFKKFQEHFQIVAEVSQIKIKHSGLRPSPTTWTEAFSAPRATHHALKWTECPCLFPLPYTHPSCLTAH